jgi:hypothetical protein
MEGTESFLPSLWGLLISVLLSFLLAVIELSYESGRRGKALFCWESALYFLILSLGNGVATLSAPLLIEAAEAPSVFASPFGYAVVGVFGFNAVLRHVNVMLFNRGVLSINDWVSKSLDTATAAIVERGVTLEYERAQQIAQRLMTLPEDELDAHVVQALGPDTLAELNARADDAGPNARLLKALTLAHEEPDQAQAIADSSN